MPKNTEVRQVRAALAQLPSQGRRFPPEVRAAVERYARRRTAEGATNLAVARELGVSAPTISRALARQSRMFVPVRVVPEAAAPVIVRGPCGVVIEGLDVAGVAKLLVELS